MYTQPFTISPSDLSFEQPLVPNEYLIIRNGKKSALATYDSDRAVVRRVDKLTAYGITSRNAEQAFALNALTNPEVKLVSISGKAGTGKTLLALAAALEHKKEYRQIFMARPVVPLSNKDIGYLPGDIQSKLDPYMQPLYDNLGVIQNQWGVTDARHKRIREMLDDEKLVIAPLAYIRGRSLVNIYFIVDEAQNLTPHEVKTIITRAGDGTKLVFTGDIFQIDHPYLNSHSNGLLPHRQDAGAEHLRSRQPDQGRTLAAGRAGEQPPLERSGRNKHNFQACATVSGVTRLRRILRSLSRDGSAWQEARISQERKRSRCPKKVRRILRSSFSSRWWPRSGAFCLATTAA
jgi:hypothetical protein